MLYLGACSADLLHRSAAFFAERTADLHIRSALPAPRYGPTLDERGMNAPLVDTASKAFSHSLRTHGIKIMPWLPAGPRAWRYRKA